MDFDTSRMAKWDRERATRLLQEMPELYRNHLAMAHCLTWEADNLDRRCGSSRSADLKGHLWALRNTAARLRQGDYLPGAVVYRSRWREDD